jgi:CHASE3 domain sensor protein
MKIQLPLVLRVQVAFGAVMAVLLVVGIIAYRSVIASSESAQWAQHTNEVLEHLANLRLGVESIESGYRDFALSGADAFLQNRAPAHCWLTTNKEPCGH